LLGEVDDRDRDKSGQDEHSPISKLRDLIHCYFEVFAPLVRIMKYDKCRQNNYNIHYHVLEYIIPHQILAMEERYSMLRSINLFYCSSCYTMDELEGGGEDNGRTQN
jgi:hypothetical protein